MIIVITLLLRYFRNVLRACRRGFTTPQARVDQVVLGTCHYVIFNSVATLFFFGEMRMVKTVMGVNTPVLV